MANAIYTKKDAVKKYMQNKNKDIKLFAEDIPTNSKAGCKRFYVLDPNIIYNKIISNSKSHFYEFWTDSMKIQFSLDLDMNGLDNYNKSLKIVKKNILKVCDGINKYYGLEYDISKIIVLESDSRYSVEESNKYSYRVIFRGICFQNHLVAKDFYKRLHEEYNIEYSDISIYGQTCLRLCYSSKYGKNAVLIPIELKINGINTMTDINTNLSPDEFFLRTMITQTYLSDQEIKQTQMKIPISKMKVKVELDNSNTINTSVSNVKLEEILFQLPSDYYNDYNKWIKVGMSLLSLETEETGSTYFCLWDRWSKQSNKYNERQAEKVWNNLKKSEKKYQLVH